MLKGETDDTLEVCLRRQDEEEDIEDDIALAHVVAEAERQVQQRSNHNHHHHHHAQHQQQPQQPPPHCSDCNACCSTATGRRPVFHGWGGHQRPLPAHARRVYPQHQQQHHQPLPPQNQNQHHHHHQQQQHQARVNSNKVRKVTTGGVGRHTCSKGNIVAYPSWNACLPAYLPLVIRRTKEKSALRCLFCSFVLSFALYCTFFLFLSHFS